eukprot:6436270-Amphidinium_carterae.1
MTRKERRIRPHLGTCCVPNLGSMASYKGCLLVCSLVQVCMYKFTRSLPDCVTEDRVRHSCSGKGPAEQLEPCRTRSLQIAKMVAVSISGHGWQHFGCVV